MLTNIKFYVLLSINFDFLIRQSAYCLSYDYW